jgi:hypothetical protein
MVGMFDHQMDIEWKPSVLAHHLHAAWAKRNVIDEMPIHDIAMDPIGAGLFHATQFFGEAGKVCGKDGGRDDDLGHQSKRSTLNAQRSTLK